MMIAGWCAWIIINWVVMRLERLTFRFPHQAMRIRRIQKEMGYLAVAGLLFIPINTYRVYFLNWAHQEQTYDQLSTNYLNLGRFLRTVPANVDTYVIVNASGVDVRGIPSSSQTVMFITDTFTKDKQEKKHVSYVLAQDMALLPLPTEKRVLIGLLNGKDKDLIQQIQKKYPSLESPQAPGDFVILKNY